MGIFKFLHMRRNARAAKRFFEGILSKTSVHPRVFMTGGLHELLPDVEHQRSKYLNNRAENSHQPTRRRERRMQRFISLQQTQLLLSIFDVIYHDFHPKKHKLQASAYRHQLDLRCLVATCCVIFRIRRDYSTYFVLVTDFVNLMMKRVESGKRAVRY